MLTRSPVVSPKEEYYADSLLTVPSTAHTAFNNFAAGAATPAIMANDIANTLSGQPQGRALHEALAAIEMENQTPGISWEQRATNYVASLIGYGVNPITWGFGAIGSLGARSIGVAAEKIAPNAVSVFMRRPLNSFFGEKLSRWLPEQIGREGEEKTLSSALISQKTLENFGSFAGAGVPQAVVNNYNLDSNHIAWGGVARDAGEMGAFGIAIGSIPFAWGILRGKVNRAIGEPPGTDVEPDKLSFALENGHIPPEEHRWYIDYLEHQKNPEEAYSTKDLERRATKIINKNGQEANIATNEAKFDILESKDIENLQGAVADQLIGNVPESYRTSLSDFIIHNRIDEIRQNPRTLDGIRGYVDFVNQKFLRKPFKIQQAEKILDDHMLKSVKENMPFSQKEIFKHMEQAGFERSHTEHLPLTIPDNIKSHLKLSERINQLQEKLKIAKRKGQPENKQTLRRIKELEARLPEILTPKEELEQLRKELLLPAISRDFERSNAYNRLVDLSHVWHNARTLLNRVHLEHEYNRQEAFRDLANQILKISDSDIPRLAKPQDVINYLKERTGGGIYPNESIEFVKEKEFVALEIPQDADNILNEQEIQVNNSAAKDLASEFHAAADKYKEFKSSESVFKNFISCVLGSLNG